KLNAITIKNYCLFFLVKKTLDCLLNIYYYTIFNLQNAYYCLKIIVTYINKALSKYLNYIYIVYLDNIFIYIYSANIAVY
ncbi:uncharacterized protein K460DRAFT_277690, partial [Cucurbitaria berberidis CBS 394.84]